MAKHVFKSAVIHSGKTFVTGQECPQELHGEMLKKGLIEESAKAPEAKASDIALKEAAEMKAKSDAAKAEADAKNKK